MPNKPVIAITGPARGALLPRFCVATIVRWYGAQPLQLRPGDNISRLDYQGVVITGGHDIDPVLYAAEQEVKPKHDKQRDEFESAVIEYALEHKMPLLGICRGAQLLNVQLGGNLFQELRSRREKTSNRWTSLPLKTLKVEARTQLEKHLGCRQCRINSLHNQGIDKVGQRMIISGRDLDGIVQAIEAPEEEFLIGVQWHPEFLLLLRRQRRLFQSLIQAVRKQLKSNS
ncbi:peptidase C26 [Aliidiomarina minuta]|uniref:Peptidase C26 n=1 Tax=Aliidiomarina minuta TaxID=880057 RepID=A0A432W5A4_9GAMM|nr:gamma-glutamyl-gamma-aminobutyrate hydrolase family protein [Aliidiomarina minuta]RUO25222.1 peptidase C26 [Aliidiomarina minuta]